MKRIFLLAIMLICFMGCKESKKNEINNNAIENKDIQNEIDVLEYKPLTKNKKLNEDLIVPWIGYKRNGNKISVLVQIEDKVYLDDYFEHNLVLMLIPVDSEKDLINEVSKSEGSTAEYHYYEIDGGDILNISGKSYIEIKFETLLSKLKRTSLYLFNTINNSTEGTIIKLYNKNFSI